MLSYKSRSYRNAALAAALTAIGASTPAYAAGWYAGAGVGQAEYEGLSDEPTSMKLFVGYSFNPNAAVEFAYVDSGEAKEDTFLGDFKASADGFEVSAVGLLPVNNTVSFLGRLGLFNWDADFELAGASASDSGTDLTYGFGVQLDLNKGVAIRAEYQIYDVDGDDVDNIGLSALFRF